MSGDNGRANVGNCNGPEAGSERNQQHRSRSISSVEYENTEDETGGKAKVGGARQYEITVDQVWSGTSSKKVSRRGALGEDGA